MGDGFRPTNSNLFRSGGRSASVSTRRPATTIVVRCDPGPGRAARSAMSGAGPPLVAPTAHFFGLLVPRHPLTHPGPKLPAGRLRCGIDGGPQVADLAQEI